VCTLSLGEHKIVAHCTAAPASFTTDADSSMPELDLIIYHATAFELTSPSLAPVLAGTSVTFTATIHQGSLLGSLATDAGGTVTFKYGSTTIPGCGAVIPSAGVATCATSALPLGPSNAQVRHAVTAQYSGDNATLYLSSQSAGPSEPSSLTRCTCR
jgi:hypothetical protein